MKVRPSTQWHVDPVNTFVSVVGTASQRLLEAELHYAGQKSNKDKGSQAKQVD